MERYEPYCPSPACTGGNKSKLYNIRAKPNWLPAEVWIQKKEGEIVYRCTYCGLIWFQLEAKRPGLDANPVGYYDDPQHPWEFVSLKHKFMIREQNTSHYWYNLGGKRGSVHPPKRGGVD